jgi:hypothetical protein
MDFYGSVYGYGLYEFCQAGVASEIAAEVAVGVAAVVLAVVLAVVAAVVVVPGDLVMVR